MIDEEKTRSIGTSGISSGLDWRGRAHLIGRLPPEASGWQSIWLARSRVHYARPNQTLESEASVFWPSRAVPGAESNAHFLQRLVVVVLVFSSLVGVVLFQLF